MNNKFYFFVLNTTLYNQKPLRFVTKTMRSTAFIILALFLYNCSSTKNITEKTTNVNFKEIINETQGGYNTAKFLVIKEEQSTLEAYMQINKIRKPGFETPSINYKKQMVLALFMGQKSSGGYGISVNHIQESNSIITVFVNERKPEVMATMAITSPFCFVVMKKSDKKIVFEKIN